MKLPVSEITLYLVEMGYESTGDYEVYEIVEITDVSNVELVTGSPDIKVYISGKSMDKAKIFIDPYHKTYSLEHSMADGNITIYTGELIHAKITMETYKTDGGDPIDKNPRIEGGVRMVKGFKALIKRDFKAVLDWMEKRIEDYARNLSEEELQQLEDYIHRLRQKWNSHNIKY